MSHPYTLLATTACWSLRRSWAQLQEAARHSDLDSTVQAWRPGSGVRSSGHADGIGNAVLRATGSDDFYLRLMERVAEDVDQARWLVAATSTQSPLAAILAALPTVDPRRARDVWGYLDHADLLARRALDLDPDHRLIGGNPACPSCDTRLLRIQASAPDPGDWIVICCAGCRCQGDACSCQMPVRERGAPHAWFGVGAATVALRGSQAAA